MRIHFMGIGGSGISGVAKLAEEFGYEVTGCDLECSTAYGKNILQGHSATHIKDADLVIVSPAVLFQNNKNPEIIEAKKQGKLITWQEFLGTILLKHKKIICIAGTHGKSTTTAMAGKLLIDNGFDPIVVVGAEVPGWGGNSRFGKGEYAVIEADEFNNNFLNYHPEMAVINNIEFDHPDFFKNEEEVHESFKKFIGNLVGKKILITEKDSLNRKFNLKVLGEHNQRNANMVFLLGKALNIDEDKIIESIESFEGISRRLELVAERNGIKIYDDYAHHPTAIKTTLEGLRKEFPKSKILAVIEPHGYKRTKALLAGYTGVFNSADEVVIGPIFKARDEVDTSVTSQKIADVSRHKNISAFNNSEQLIENCKLIIDDYNVVVIMGAGKSYIWAKEIEDLIPIKFSELTTFRIGGKIKKYVEIRGKDELVGVIKSVKNEGLPIFVIGGGSDILASDNEFPGVVIKYVGGSISFREGGAVIAEAGTDWDKLVEESVNRGLAGIECLSGIPGTVGAAPVQNIGAYGQEFEEVFVGLEAYDIDNEKFVTFNKEACKFGYRESIFKKKDNSQKYIICNITLKLSKNIPKKKHYESLEKYLSSQNSTLSEVRNAVLAARKDRLEDPKKVGNAGSFFMNFVVDLPDKMELESKFPGIKIYPYDDKFKVSAGWLIESAGWKGREYEDARVSSKNALILINNGKAKAHDVYELSEKIISDVNKKFGIKLEREVQLVNF